MGWVKNRLTDLHIAVSWSNKSWSAMDGVIRTKLYGPTACNAPKVIAEAYFRPHLRDVIKLW